MDNRLPDPFIPDPPSWGAGRSLGEGKELDQTLSKIFVVHLHNQWAKPFPKDGWVDRLLLRKYNKQLPLLKQNHQQDLDTEYNTQVAS